MQYVHEQRSPVEILGPPRSFFEFRPQRGSDAVVRVEYVALRLLGPCIACLRKAFREQLDRVYAAADVVWWRHPIGYVSEDGDFDTGMFSLRARLQTSPPIDPELFAVKAEGEATPRCPCTCGRQP